MHADLQAYDTQDVFVMSTHIRGSYLYCSHYVISTCHFQHFLCVISTSFTFILAFLRITLADYVQENTRNIGIFHLLIQHH